MMLQRLNNILKNKFRRRVFFIILGLILWAAIALPTVLTFLEVGHDEFSRKGNDLLFSTDIDDNIYIELRLQYLDLPKRVIRYYAEFSPYGKYINKEENKWNLDITIDFWHKIYNLKNDSKIEPVIFDVPLISGNIMDYPFDNYKALIKFVAQDTKDAKYIPVTVGTSISSPNTLISFTPFPLQESNIHDIKVYVVEIKRTAIVYIFCLFVSLVIWSMAIALLNFTADTAYLGRDLPVQLPALGVALLFAIPTFRKIQPDIPDIGCAIDFLCFIWCEIIISISTSINLYTWLKKLKNASDN